MLPKLCHLDNDLEIIIIIYTVSEYEYIYCVVHMTYIPYLGTFFFSRYPSVALARNFSLGTSGYVHTPSVCGGNFCCCCSVSFFVVLVYIGSHSYVPVLHTF